MATTCNSLTRIPAPLGLAFALFGFWAPLRADGGLEPRPFERFTLEELMSVEVRAPTKVDQPIREAPTVGTVITRSQIDDYAWLTLGDVLLRQAGFSPSQDYERVTVSGRGQYESWNNNHLRLLIDGVPVNNVSNGIAHTWEMLPLSMIESIEIIRGPGSALYGSNATNGVIAINTRKPYGGGPIEARAGVGNAGTRVLDVTAGRALPLMRVLAGYQYEGTGGNSYASYDASGRVDGAGNLRKFTVNDERSTHAGFLKLDGLGPLAGLSLQTHFAWWSFETAQGWLHVVPDEPEIARNNRTLVALTWRPPALLSERLQLEAAAEWQRHEVDYRIKYLPDSSSFYGIAYPHGVIEIAQTAPNDYFARLQADYRLAGDWRLLAGVENTVFIWGQDIDHEANVDINRGGSFQPYPNGDFHTIQPLFESVVDQPIENMGLFAQASSGRVLNRMVSATAGVRYDLQYFQYADLDNAARPMLDRYLDQVSPRVGLVFFPHPALTLKAMAERAFRAPAPSELFVTNSLLGNSRTDQLQPEEMTAYTLAADLAPVRHLDLRVDGFYQEFENQIAFSGSKNYSTNLYSRTTAGVETELLFDAAVVGGWSLDGFANFTWSHQLDETILEPAIAAADYLTWAPEKSGNMGATVSRRGLGVSLQAHYQGEVYRRDSDHGSSSAYRPDMLDAWVAFDAALSWRFDGGLRLRLKGTNIFDSEGYLMKPGNYPFDYRIEGARVLADVEYALGGLPSGARHQD